MWSAARSAAAVPNEGLSEIVLSGESARNTAAAERAALHITAKHILIAGLIAQSTFALQMNIACIRDEGFP
jgi:hypothetical protein